MGGAPGGPASFACPERGVPFKLTREMVMVLGGKGSPLSGDQSRGIGTPRGSLLLPHEPMP